MRTHQAQQLEVEARRSGVDFRNRAGDGPHLSIGGANWQLPSRVTAARPKFVDGKPTFAEAAGDFPSADAMMLNVPELDARTCPTCGHETTRFDLLEQTEWLALALTAVVEALSVKYDLSDGQLDELLQIDQDAAVWVVQLTQWAIGGDTTLPSPRPVIPDVSQLLDEYGDVRGPADDPVKPRPLWKRILHVG